MQLSPRQVADAYVDKAVQLDPIMGTLLGLPHAMDRLPDHSPAGSAAEAALQRETLLALDQAEAAAGGLDALDPAERRCAVLLRERMVSALALHDSGEHLRRLGALFAPPSYIRRVFTLMPTETAADWSVIAARLRAVPDALSGYRESLAKGLAEDLPSGPAQVRTVVALIDGWLDTRSGPDWFAGFVADAPADQAGELGAAAGAAATAYAEFRDWLRDDYGPAVESAPDAVGAERYVAAARQWNGAELDLDEAYDWAWAEFGRIDAQMREQAELVLPGSTPKQAMDHLDEHGPAIEGVENVREWLQQVMDDAIAAVDGVYFDLSEPVRRVEAMIAPAGSAAAPYYTLPSADFSRPGRTWLPVLGRTRFPTWNLLSIWYHEGVPGHHLQIGQWVHAAGQLSRYQTGPGMVNANVEGWALYAERLMDEVGLFTDPGTRLGFLAMQQARAVRVIVDIGMHLEREIPHDQGGAEPFEAGSRWTPELAERFMRLNTGLDPDFVASEITRYLELPGQAIGYKLGERAWLQGREAARQRYGAEFDLRTWHNAALTTGSLGLDDLVRELGVLGRRQPAQ